MKMISKLLSALLGIATTTIVVAAPVGMYEDTLQYDYDLAGNLINRWGGDTNKNYTYDNLYRLINESDDTGSVQSFTYDPIGNRLSDDLNGQSTPYQYPLENSRLLSQGNNTYTRDAVGNTLSDHSGARTFTYTPDNRIHQVFDNGVLIATYTYNALGQRTQKTTPQSTTYYVYGLNGELQGEYDQNGNVIREYVYLNREPIAQLNADDSVTYLHTDHLGTPRRATDEAGEVVWSWNSDAFGATPADTDPDGDGQATQVNLRFPGQYFDEETGLHYNYYRYYDPKTGRYMTSDPIGLAGGINTYGYVGGNPVHFFDVQGLDYGIGVDPNGAGGNGHTTLYYQDSDGKWNTFDQGARGMTSSGVESNSGPGRASHFDPSKLYGNMPASAVTTVISKPPVGTLIFPTSKEKDELIAACAEVVRDSYNNGDRDYQLLSENCTDAVEKVLACAGLEISNPWYLPRPNDWFKSLK